MTLADKFTSSRLVFAPVFFIFYFLPQFFPSIGPALWTVPLLLILFAVSEFTDMLDGMIARKRGEVGDFGRLFDPFADTVTQITYFLCFVVDGIFPAFLFLIVLYREFGILFIRNLMLKRGIAQGARKSGKIKTILYISALSLALIASSMIRIGVDEKICHWLLFAAKTVFILSVVIAVVSFIDYLLIFLKNSEKKL